MSLRRSRCSNRARSLACFLSLFLIVAIAGCGGASSSGGSGTPTKTLQSIAASPAKADLSVGAEEQFTATATYSDGSTGDVTQSATWTDTNSKIATLTTSGMATAIAPGSTTITATLDGLSGSAALTVPTPAKTLASIAVSPAGPGILVGATQQFTATATYSDSSTADVTATATWTSSNKSVATITSAGLATAIAPGSAAITATVSGVSGKATVTVPAPAKTLSAIAIAPPAPTIAAGATQQFTATATYSDHTTGDVTATAAWISSNKSVATIATGGLATAVAVGSAVISASLNGVQATAALTVTPALSSITVTPANPSIAGGATQQFTAIANYSDGTTKDITATATWASSNTAVATIGAGGLATGVSAGSATISATFSGVSGSTALAITGITSISISPATPSFATGATQQFTATATYSDTSTADITATATWASSNTAVATINSAGLATGVAAGSATISASLQGKTGSVTAAVTIPAGTGVNVTTWHVDNNRSGLNASETTLTPANVTPKTFGRLFSYPIDGYAYAEPLLMSNVTINGAQHNVLYVATENDSVYAFDADNYGDGSPLWKASLMQPGETLISAGTITPTEGVTSTPVIDPATNTLYVVSVQKPANGAAGFRLNALDITTGHQKTGSPVAIAASVPGTNSSNVGGVVSLPTSCIQRAALLLSNGTIYIGFGSCHSGWLLAYDEATLQQVGVFNASPDLNGEGSYASAGGVWMGSGGPVADSAGNIYVSTGNGPWDGSTAWSDSILKFNPKLAPGSSGSQVQDYFTPQDYAYMNCSDSDLAAGGIMMIPGSSQIVGGGKMGKLYLVNTANLGQEQANDAGAAQTIFLETNLINSYPWSCTDNVPVPGSVHTTNINSYEIFGTAAYFNGSIYLGVTPTSTTAPAVVRRLGYSAGQLSPQEFTSPNIQENTRGTTPFISANGTSNGILWMIDEGQPLGSSSPTAATLRAYDAQNLSDELYNSSQNSGDVPGYGIKFSSPVVANGKVYISTGHDLTTASQPQGEIDVYGLK